MWDEKKLNCTKVVRMKSYTAQLASPYSYYTECNISFIRFLQPLALWRVMGGMGLGLLGKREGEYIQAEAAC